MTKVSSEDEMYSLSLLRKISNIAWKQDIVHERKSESKFNVSGKSYGESHLRSENYR